ncbi:MAG: hypothetical protein JWO73_83 [Candidatus Taylorbacteria bacterium]|nr:hypothetical protein [Candidatus Taylorbacteria bacterium]
MNKPLFPTWAIVLLSILAALLLAVAVSIAYLVHNPSVASIPGRLVKKYIDQKVDTIGHAIYLHVLQDPDKDKDGLTDIAEKEIYKTDPTKFDSNGAGVGDGEYVYDVYKKAFDTSDESLLTPYRKNIDSYKKFSSRSTSTNEFLGTGSLDDAFTYRSLQTYNLYVGMPDDLVQTVKKALDSRLKKGDYQGSLELLESALSKDPNSAILKYHLGLTYHGMKQYDQALSIYKSIENDPTVKSPLLYSDIASAELALGNDDAFFRYLDLSIKDFPEDLNQYLTLASYYLDKNQLDKSEEILNAGLKIEPRYASFYNALALIASRRNDTKAEFDLYKKALSFDFRYAPGHLNLSILYDQKYDDRKAAMTEAQISMELERNARHISRVIDLYNEIGQYAKSKALEAELLKMPDVDARSYNDLGLMYMDREDYKQAETYLRKSIALEPRLSNAYNNLGIVLSNTGRNDESAVNYKKAIEINPNYANAYNNLGAYYMDAGRYAEAQAALEKAIQLDPYTYRQYQNLGAVYRLLRDREQMIFYYRKAVELGSKDPAILDYLKTLNR